MPQVGSQVVELPFWQWGFGVLHAVAMVSLAIVVSAWGRHGGRRRFAASATITVCVIVAAFVAAVAPRDIPIEWISVLHHGLERKTIMHLYARGAHAGANFGFVLSAIAAGAPNLYHVVWLNLLLGLVNAALFFHVAMYVTRVRWALVWTAVFALNPAMFYACFSELPTNLLALYFFAAVVAWAVVYDPLPQPRWVRIAGCVQCAVLTVLAAFTRPEVATLGVVALGLHVAHAILGAQRWSAATDRLRVAGERGLVFLSDHPGMVAALCMLGWWFSKAGIPGWIGRSEVSGLYPFNPSIFSLFFYLPMLLLPLGVSIAVFFGFVHALARFRQFGGLALSLLLLVRAYFAAQYEYFEMGRYLSYVLPSVFLLGLFGGEQLDEVVRRWRPTWCRAVRVGYLMAWFTLPLPGIFEFYSRPDYQRSGGFAQLLLDRNNQREVRYLLDLVERNPECVFVTRVVDDLSELMTATRYLYIVFGAPLAQPVVVHEESDLRLDDLIARHAPGAGCVRLYYGGDCNLTFTDRCRAFVAGKRLVEEHRFWSRLYNNPLQSGYAEPEVVLATYAWP